MALPTTSYDTATILNPGSALTDFTLLIDLSRMSTAWKTEFNTSEGRKGRAAKDDGTELACDFMDCDHSAGTGWLRVKWSGTLASSGTQVIRIYPPNTANSTNLRTATYGQYNAYDDEWLGYWPLMEDATDRTAERNDGTTLLGHTIGGVTGQAGNATAFDGVDQYINIPWDSTLSPTNTAIEMSCWVKAPFEPNDWGSFFGRSTGGGDYDYSFGHRGGSHSPFIGNRSPANDTVQAIGSTDFDDTWLHVRGTIDGESAGEAEIWVDNVSEATDPEEGAGIAFDGSATNDVWIGRSPIVGTVYIDADIQHMKFEDSVRSDDWAQHEYDQGNDQASFWGTWSNNPVASSRRVLMCS